MTIERPLDDEPPVSQVKSLAQANLSLFLSLFLLLLAFFVVLNTLSVHEAKKSETVQRSLRQTFVGDEESGPQSDLVPTGPVPMATEVRSLLEDVSRMVQEEIPLAKVVVAPPGNVLQARLRTDALFVPDTVTLRPPRWKFLDRVVGAVGAAPPGLAYRMEFRLGSDYDPMQPPPKEATVQMRRATEFARALVERGAPPGFIAVGLEQGDPEQVRLVFRIIDVSVPREGSEIERNG